MCEILAEILARNAYLVRSAGHMSRMPLEITAATSITRCAMRDARSYIFHAASPDLKNTLEAGTG
ncbi:MAG: hypothetical protein LCH36_12250 [Actinobacteria bacterium]|nr:hypothetical protein [Actinomycetota bacterium]